MGLAGDGPRRSSHGLGLDTLARLGGLADVTHAGHPRQRGLERAARRQPARADHAAHVDRHVGRQLLDGEHRAEVVGDRVEAAAVDQTRAGGHGGGVVGDVHPVDELALAGDVAVVGAGVGAGGHERLAAAHVGADGRQDHLGAGRQLGQGGGVSGVGHDQLDVRADLGPDLLQLVEAAAGEGPAQAFGAVVSEVVGGQCPGEAGRAEEDDVELAAVGPAGGHCLIVAGAEPLAAADRRTPMHQLARTGLAVTAVGALGAAFAAGVAFGSQTPTATPDDRPGHQGQRPPAGQRRPPPGRQLRGAAEVVRRARRRPRHAVRLGLPAGLHARGQRGRLAGAR